MALFPLWSWHHPRNPKNGASTLCTMGPALPVHGSSLLMVSSGHQAACWVRVCMSAVIRGRRLLIRGAARIQTGSSLSYVCVLAVSSASTKTALLFDSTGTHRAMTPPGCPPTVACHSCPVAWRRIVCMIPKECRWWALQRHQTPTY